MTKADDFRRRFVESAGADLSRMSYATDASFEHKRVLQLLKYLKLQTYKSQLIEGTRATADNPLLTFSAFNELFPTFPIVFGASTLRRIGVPWGDKTTSHDYVVHRDPYAVEPARFKNFQWVSFFCAYRAFYDTVGDRTKTHKVALLFPRKGFIDGMVIHNDDSEAYWDDGLCWVYKMPKTAKRLYVQPFLALVRGLEVVGNSWLPSES